MTVNSVSVFRGEERIRARRIRATLTAPRSVIDVMFPGDWSFYLGRVTIESDELVEEARQVWGGNGMVTVPARYRIVVLVEFLPTPRV